MRPLMEILEDERTLALRLDSLYRYLTKVDDCEIIDMIYAKKKRIEQDLEKVRGELREYLSRLFE